MQHSISELSADVIRMMSFSDIVALVNEPNTPSGAHESIRTILTELPTARLSSILDVGCNTGFASLEFASWLSAHVIGVDINERSLEHARERAKALQLTNVEFVNASLLDLPYADGTFDMVYCNNVTSFINNRREAADEYTRVLRPGGILAAVPIYYCETPPEKIVQEVSQVIQASVVVRGKEQWLECFGGARLRPFYSKDFRYDYKTKSEIERYAAEIVNVDRLPFLTSVQLAAAAERLQEMYVLFNENLRYAGFSVLLFRNREPNDHRVLHTSYHVSA